MRLNEFVG